MIYRNIHIDDSIHFWQSALVHLPLQYESIQNLSQDSDVSSTSL